ncbi:MAG: hypothetical protein JRI23_03885 [Deltaproteobacteria bacterium]|jgi:hypothetical protein|nr:hypothetical protein [Deltaproteobacteria bacterium]MBW2530669.1 hypothetical protein [Deltaproteobacteria bacterium]
MRWVVTWAVSALLCAAMTGSCSSDSSDDGSGGDPNTGGGGTGASAGTGGTGGTGGTPATVGDVAIDDAPAMWAQAYCDAAVECSRYSIIVNSAPPPYGTTLLLPEPDCVNETAAMFEDYFAALETAIAAGKSAYDPAKMGECVAATAADCGALGYGMPPACDEAMQGTVSPGGACTAHFDCEGEATCDTGEGCPGICEPRVGFLQECREARCQWGFDCRNGITCMPYTQLGEPCGSNEPQCEAGTVCRGEPETCRPNAEVFGLNEGAPCDPVARDYCTPDLACTFDSAAGTTLSFACAPKVASGALCVLAFPSQCPFGEYCQGLDIETEQYTGTCAPLPEAGQPCADNIGTKPCASGNACVANTCRAMGHVGDSCNADYQCYMPGCDGGVCIPFNQCPQQP